MYTYMYLVTSEETVPSDAPLFSLCALATRGIPLPFFFILFPFSVSDCKSQRSEGE